MARLGPIWLRLMWHFAGARNPADGFGEDCRQGGAAVVRRLQGRGEFGRWLADHLDALDFQRLIRPFEDILEGPDAFDADAGSVSVGTIEPGWAATGRDRNRAASCCTVCLALLRVVREFQPSKCDVFVGQPNQSAGQPEP